MSTGPAVLDGIVSIVDGTHVVGGIVAIGVVVLAIGVLFMASLDIVLVPNVADVPSVTDTVGVKRVDCCSTRDDITAKSVTFNELMVDCLDEPSASRATMLELCAAMLDCLVEPSAIRARVFEVCAAMAVCCVESLAFNVDMLASYADTVSSSSVRLTPAMITDLLMEALMTRLSSWSSPMNEASCG